MTGAKKERGYDGESAPMVFPRGDARKARKPNERAARVKKSKTSGKGGEFQKKRGGVGKAQTGWGQKDPLQKKNPRKPSCRTAHDLR